MGDGDNSATLARLDERTANMDAKLDKALEQQEKQDERLRIVEQEQERIKERMRTAHGLQALYTTLGTALAAFLGGQR